MFENPNTTCIDRDGNVIRKGMSVVSGGDTWVVGFASPRIVRLDRHMPSGCAQSRVLGLSRLCCIHIIGFTSPLVFKDGNNPYEG